MKGISRVEEWEALLKNLKESSFYTMRITGNIFKEK